MTRTHLRQRLLGLLGGATLATAGLVGAAVPAQAAACSGTNGVTVVVQSNGGPNATRCVSGDPSSAMEALRSAGFSVSQPSRFPGAICRINGYPASEPCINMPPADAYWGFFHGPAGGSWTYSDSGAASYNPKPGSSVGFRFGSGSAPSVPPASPAPAPDPTTAAPKPTTAAPKTTTAVPKPTAAAPRTTTRPGATGSGPVTQGPGATASGSTGATATASASASPSGSSTGSPSASSPIPADSPSADGGTVSAAHEPPSGGSGSSGRLVGGGVLLLALASAVGAVALRRGRAVAA